MHTMLFMQKLIGAGEHSMASIPVQRAHPYNSPPAPDFKRVMCTGWLPLNRRRAFAR